MPTMTVMRGLPGSGKSTLARRNSELDGAVRVSRDDLRVALFNQTGILSHEKEDLITKIQRQQAKIALKSGMNVIVDDMNLRASYVRDWHKVAVAEGSEFKIHTVPTDVDECVRRDSARARVVGEEVIRGLHQRFFPLAEYDVTQDPWANSQKGKPVRFGKILQNTTLPHTILVDIDGTIALMNGRRGPYEWDKVLGDSVNRPVAQIVKEHLQSGGRVTFLSGRSDICREDTKMWLCRILPAKFDKQWELYMRKDGDGRPDDIVKREIFDSMIAPYYYVEYILDDRPKVIRMWAESGLPVFDVDPLGPDF